MYRLSRSSPLPLGEEAAPPILRVNRIASRRVASPPRAAPPAGAPVSGWLVAFNNKIHTDRDDGGRDIDLNMIHVQEQ